MMEKFEKISLAELVMYIIVIDVFGELILDMFGGPNGFVESLVISVCKLGVILMLIKHNGDKLDYDISIFKKRDVKLEITKLLILKLIFSFAVVILTIKMLCIINPSNKKEILDQKLPDYGLYLNLILICIVAPIVEEFVFRGVIFSRLYKEHGAITAMLVSSAIFSLLHIKMGIIQAFVLGILMCVVFKKYNNILVNISIHILNNLIAVVISSLPGTASTSQLETSSLDAIFFISLVVTLISGWFVFKYIKDNWGVMKKDSEELVNEVSC